MSNLFQTPSSIGSFITNTVNEAAKNIFFAEGDYLNSEDSLWYCGKCHTPKQRYFFTDIVPCLCKCEADRIDKEHREREHRRRVERAQSLAFDSSELIKQTFSNDDGANPKIMDALKRYVDNFPTFYTKGKGLLLYGDVGTGKTYMANSIVNELIEQGWLCRSTNFSRIIEENRKNNTRQEYIDTLNERYALLVIDDLGVERNSEYAQEIIWSVIDSRYRAKMPLIVTTNLSIEEIKNPADEATRRIYSRILEMCHPIHIEGGDRRRQKVREDFPKMKELLGL